MGLIELQVQSRAPVSKVYAMAHSTPEFVDVMPNIKVIRKLDENNERTYSKTEWVLDVPLPAIFGELSWIKDTFWDNDAHKCEIRLNPDCRSIVKRISGLWTFHQHPDGCEMNMRMQIKVTHPLVGRKTKSTIDTMMADNIECLMRAISSKAETGARTVAV